MTQLVIIEYFTKDQASVAVMIDIIMRRRQSTLKESGCEKIDRYVNQDDPNHIISVQHWASREHQAEYLKWAHAQPDSDELQACWLKPPRVTWLDIQEA